MNPKNTSNEENLEELDMDDQAFTVDDFIKELEEKEKSLEISSDLVIEVGESDVEHENIHDSFISGNSSSQIKIENLPDSQQTAFQSTPTQPDDYAKLKSEVSSLRVERDELKKTMLRRQKDFDNYRNRTERERSETFKNILSSLATQMLPVLDNMNRALDSTANAEKEGEQDFQNFFEGVVLVNQQLNEVLVGMGVNPIKAVGQPFDPNFHEAVASEENNEVPPNTVIQELLVGYCVDNKVIRPSMVKVSTDKSNHSPAKEEAK